MGQAQKGHTKSNLMEQRPNYDFIIEAGVYLNQYTRFSLSRKSIWIKILESPLSREFIWIKTMETFWVMSRFESNSRNHFESWVDLNYFLKAIVSHELSRNQNFLKLSWVKSNEFESYPCLRETYRKETTSHSSAKSSGANWAKSSGTLIDIGWSQEVL